MPLNQLVPTDQQAAFDIQETTLAHDLMGRYLCNTWSEVAAQQAAGGLPFDVVVIGAGMFGGYACERLYRMGAALGLRILVLEAGAYLLPSHIQNLPQRLGGKIGGSPLRTHDTGTENVIWGMPWISNVGFPGLAYCIGGRSLFWGGWSPQLTDADLANWPNDVKDYLKGGADAYALTENEIGVTPGTDYIVQNTLYKGLKASLETAAKQVPTINTVADAPLAVQGASPGPGIFPFDKFSSAPFLFDAVREDVGLNSLRGDLSRRLFLVPRAQVHRLFTAGGRVTGIEFSCDGQRHTLPLAPVSAVLLANGTIEATRLALDSLGLGSRQFGSPRLGNLIAHLRSNVIVRIKRSALGLPAKPDELETTAFLIRGAANGRRFHFQVTAGAVTGSDSEKNMWSMVPDTEFLHAIIANQNPDWVVVTLRGIGEMEDHRGQPDPASSWVDLSPETDQWGIRRAFVNLSPTANDLALWKAMDDSAFELAKNLSGKPNDIEYWDPKQGTFSSNPPKANPDGSGPWRDGLGTTHHEAGTLFMGNPGESQTDSFGKLHDFANVYVAGPALFPTLGSANPSLTAISLARRTAKAIVDSNLSPLEPGFEMLSLDPKDWQLVRKPGDRASMLHLGSVLETFEYYGLSWYTKEEFSNFILKLDWRVSRRDNNSGVYIRTPGTNGVNPLGDADSQGHEIQIDERGFDSTNQSEGNPLKQTGAVYGLQGPSELASNPVGEWNTYLIEAKGDNLKITLNGQLINDYVSNRPKTGFIALQCHSAGTGVQFKGLQVKRLK